MTLLATTQELERIRSTIRNFLRLPFGFKSVPGDLLEAIIEEVRGKGTERLNTYDFVDVINSSEKIGWQVKSTNYNTPVTWIRGKISNKQELINASNDSDEGCQQLGNAILDYCNIHVAASLKKYDLEQIGYAHLIKNGNSFRYFETVIVTSKNPVLFEPADFEWRWSTPKKITKKEQLPALHGYHRQTNQKYFAWHGQGENQLHFNGEKVWWPAEDYIHGIKFNMPTDSEKVSLEELTEWLMKL